MKDHITHSNPYGDISSIHILKRILEKKYPIHNIQIFYINPTQKK